MDHWIDIRTPSQGFKQPGSPDNVSIQRLERCGKTRLRVALRSKMENIVWLAFHNGILQ